MRLTLRLPTDVVAALEALRDAPVDETIELAVAYRLDRLADEHGGPIRDEIEVSPETALRAHYTALTQLSHGSEEAYDVHLEIALTDLLQLPEAFVVDGQPVDAWLEVHA